MFVHRPFWRHCLGVLALFASLLVSASASAQAQELCGLLTCGTNEECCDYACVDLDSDTNHCGQCGNACESDETCNGGTCACGNDVCTASESCCGAGNCVDLNFDEANCGACGNVCGDGEICVGGTCACIDGENLDFCGADEGCCPGIGCKDLSSDTTHCGVCGSDCGAGEWCDEGNCRCGSTFVSTGFPVCDGGETCCGFPGQCKPDGECAANGVRCGDGQEACLDPNGRLSCRNLLDDRLNCGACGNACDQGRVCSFGSCIPGCPAGQTSCGGQCHDLQSSRFHCGGCGKPCGPGEVCGQGKCVLTCGVGFTTCGDSCHDLQSDNAHCGACNNPCGPGEVCDGSGQCDTTCQTGKTECSGDCVDLDTDRSNCGACGVQCPAGEICDGQGQCQLTCQTGQTACGGQCADLQNDRSNCGACGAACPPGMVCDGTGQCALSCQTGFTDCGGECRELFTDFNHCGACNSPCSAGDVCIAGQCESFTLCPVGTTNCGGVCVPLDTNPDNCGACGLQCFPGEICTDGYCSSSCGDLANCGDGFADLDNDPFHCGACGVDCGAEGVCVAGVCSDRRLAVLSLDESDCTTVETTSGDYILAAGRTIVQAGQEVTLYRPNLTAKGPKKPYGAALLVMDHGTNHLWAFGTASTSPATPASAPGIVDAILRIKPSNGKVLETVALEFPLNISAGSGLFSGNGVVGVLDAGLRLIDPATGAITNLTSVGPLDSHPVCDNGVFSGVLETSASGLHLVYAGDFGVVRTRFADGATVLLTPTDTGASCSVAALPKKKKWLTYSSVTGQLISCPARFDANL